MGANVAFQPVTTRSAGAAASLLVVPGQRHGRCFYMMILMHHPPTLLLGRTHLYEPHVVVAPQLVGDHPRGEDVPLHGLAAIDADAQLCVLVLRGLQVREHLLGQLS